MTASDRYNIICIINVTYSFSIASFFLNSDELQLTGITD